MLILSGRSQSEKVTYCMILTIRQKKQTYRDSIMISGSQRVEVGVRDELVEHRGFLGQWKYSVWYHTNESIIIHLFKPIECTIPRVNPNVSHELWVTGCINVDSSSEANMSFTFQSWNVTTEMKPNRCRWESLSLLYCWKILKISPSVISTKLSARRKERLLFHRLPILMARAWHCNSKYNLRK